MLFRSHACVEPSEIPAIRALADRFPELRYSVGVHPLDPEHWAAETPQVLRAAAQDDPRVVAIGELGLDLFRDKNLEQQLTMLRPPGDMAVAPSVTRVAGGTTCAGLISVMTGAIELSAAFVSSIPAPHRPSLPDKEQTLPAGKGRADARSIATTSLRDSVGFNDSINAIVPATCGAAMLVPCFNA